MITLGKIRVKPLHWLNRLQVNLFRYYLSSAMVLNFLSNLVNYYFGKMAFIGPTVEFYKKLAKENNIWMSLGGIHETIQNEVYYFLMFVSIANTLAVFIP